MTHTFFNSSTHSAFLRSLDDAEHTRVLRTIKKQLDDSDATMSLKDFLPSIGNQVRTVYQRDNDENDIKRIYDQAIKIRSNSEKAKAESDKINSAYENVQKLLAAASNREKKKIERRHNHVIAEYEHQQKRPAQKLKPLTQAQLDVGLAIHLYNERHAIVKQQRKEEAKIAEKEEKKRAKEIAEAEAAAKKLEREKEKQKAKEEKQVAEREAKLHRQQLSIYEEQRMRKKQKIQQQHDIDTTLKVAASSVLLSIINTDPAAQRLYDTMMQKTMMQKATERKEQEDDLLTDDTEVDKENKEN